MPIRLIIISLAVFVAASAKGLCEQKTFTETVRVVMGSRETQEEAREYALLEAKRRVLEKVGVYIEGRSVLMQRIRESATSITDETDMQKRVLAIAAGVTQLEVVGEEWKSEGGALVLYLTCRITLNPDDVAQRLTELVKNKQKVEDYERVQAEVARLCDELAQLRSDLESAKSEKETKAVKEEVAGKINELTANDWIMKGSAYTSVDNKIEAFSKAIDLAPNWGLAYAFRGAVFSIKGYHERALQDYNKAIELDEGLSPAYMGRGVIYMNTGFSEKAVQEYTLAILKDFSSSEAYVLRADAYYSLKYYDLAIADCNRAIALDPKNPQGFYLRAAASYGKTMDYKLPFTAEDVRQRDFLCRSAIEDGLKALDLNPFDADTYLALGMYYAMSQDFAKARMYLSRAKDLGDPDAEGMLRALPK